MASANGEDFLYMFYNQEQGDYILLPYNIIEQAVETPIRCSGFASFKNGKMLQMKTNDEPTRHHTIQVWQTPFLTEQTEVHAKKETLLYKIGNPEIVRFMAEANELIKHIQREESYQDMYVDIVKKTVEITDAYFWIDKPDAYDPKSILLQVKAIASGAIDEFEKLVRLKRHAAEKRKEVASRVEALITRFAPQGMTRIDLFVDFLNGLRKVRGEIIALRELRHMHIDATHQLEKAVEEATEKASHQCVKFLLTAEALAPFEARIPQFQNAAASLTRVSDVQNVLKDLKAFAHDLEMLIEIVGNLKIEDTTQTTKIIEKISNIFTDLNKIKAALTQKMKALRRMEGVAEFNAQLKLLNQSAINFLDMSDTKEKCTEYAMRILVQLETLEGRFSEFDEYIVQLAEKRAELTTAFENRKLNLVETANKKADALGRSAERILNSIAVKVALLKEADAIHSYFAADQMVAKIREMIQQLVTMEHTVKADDLESRLKTLREDAVRQLKDRQELFVDGTNIIRFGNFKFSVNHQPLDLTLLPRDGVQYFHLNGTRFFEAIDDEAFNRTKPVWDMAIPSENESVYRSEFLAFQLLKDLKIKGQEHWTRLRPQKPSASTADQGDARMSDFLDYIQA